MIAGEVCTRREQTVRGLHRNGSDFPSPLGNIATIYAWITAHIPIAWTEQGPLRPP
jgi:hypothetical protein